MKRCFTYVDVIPGLHTHTHVSIHEGSLLPSCEREKNTDWRSTELPVTGGLWHPHRCPLVLAKCQWDRWGSVISSVQDSSNAVSEAFIFATISGIVLGSIGVDSYDVIAIVHVSINRGSSLPTLEMTADAGTLATRAGGGVAPQQVVDLTKRRWDSALPYRRVFV